MRQKKTLAFILSGVMALSLVGLPTATEFFAYDTPSTEDTLKVLQSEQAQEGLDGFISEAIPDIAPVGTAPEASAEGWDQDAEDGFFTSEALVVPAIAPSPEKAYEVEDDYVFDIREGGALLDSYVGTDKVVLVPQVLGGYPVTGIEDGAFPAETILLGTKGSIAEDYANRNGNLYAYTDLADGQIAADASVSLDRIAAYMPNVASETDGFSVTGFESPIAFRMGMTSTFKVTSSSAKTIFGEDLIAGDCCWSPMFWMFFGSSIQMDMPEDAQVAQSARTFTLRSDEAEYHTPGQHCLYVFMRLFQWNGSAWEAGNKLATVPVVYTVAGEGALTPTPTPAVRVEAFIPEVNSVEDGFAVTGLEEPLEFPAGSSHSFKVVGASAEAKYGFNLLVGDAKWAPIYWTTTNSDEMQNYVSGDIPYDERIWSMKSTSGIYNQSGSSKIILHFRMFLWSGSTWVPTSSYSTVEYVFQIASITPTPSPSPTATPTPTSTPSPTPTPTPAGSLTIPDESVTLYYGSASAYRKYTIKPTLAGVIKDATVKYKSADKAIAKVSSAGVVSAKAAGSTTITVYVKKDGKTYKQKLKVNVKTPTLSLSTDSVTLKVGGTFTITATAKPKPSSISFSSTYKNIATVTTKGVVTAKAPGECEIVVIANTIEKRLKVKVVAAT